MSWQIVLFFIFLISRVTGQPVWGHPSEAATAPPPMSPRCHFQAQGHVRLGERPSPDPQPGSSQEKINKIIKTLLEATPLTAPSRGGGRPLTAPSPRPSPTAHLPPLPGPSRGGRGGSGVRMRARAPCWAEAAPRPLRAVGGGHKMAAPKPAPNPPQIPLCVRPYRPDRESHVPLEVQSF